MATSSKIEPSAKEQTNVSTQAELARSELAQTAQLTLISILLASILGALFIGLPVNFSSHVFSQSEWGVDIRVLGTFLAALDLWIEYAWSAISKTWVFAVRHNVTYFLLTGTLIGLALSVNQNGSWLAWGAAVGLVSAVATVVNAFWPIRARIEELLHGASAQTKETRDKIHRLATFRRTAFVQIVVYTIGGLILLIAALIDNGARPAAQTIGWSSLGWAIFFLVVVIGDLTYYGFRGMVEEPELADLLFDPPAMSSGINHSA